MARAIWKGAVLAEAPADRVEMLEGNAYFPRDAVEDQYLEPSDHTTECPWKGTAHYYHVVVDGKENPNAAWYYPAPKDAAAQIRDHIAFWHGVEVE